MKITPVTTQRPAADTLERNDEIDLGQLALTLWRGKFIIGGLAILGFVIGVCVASCRQSRFTPQKQ